MLWLLNKAFSGLAEGLIWTYRGFISPLLHLWVGPGQGCRFVPTCSQYTKEAVNVHGIFRGGLLATYRLGRCNPFCRPGYDPVPMVSTPLIIQTDSKGN